VDEISLMTHFSDADGARGISHQLQVFNEVTRDLPGERSLSNSAATLRHTTPPDGAGLASDWIRPGIVLYGSAPDHPEHTSLDWGLLPTMTLSSKLIATQVINTGASVGYGSTFVADQPMTVGIVACGYADGYPRVCPTGTPVLVAGHRTRLVGRVSMDMLIVDLTPLLKAGQNVGMGSEVTLWGRASNGAVLGIDEVAQAAGTLGYELMCALAPRVPVQVQD
jgi:alanine racemase